MSAFDATEFTERLQDAVRSHDCVTLDELISERFVFVSARALGRLGKAEWIDAAMQVKWRTFRVTIVRVVQLAGVVLVDHDIEQEIEAPSGWAAQAPTRSCSSSAALNTRSKWITTDAWTEEDGNWRLVARHPELRG